MKQPCLTVCCPILVFWSLRSGGFLASTETVFQPTYLEFLPREAKAQSEEKRRGCGAVVKVVFRPEAKPWFRYIPVSQSRNIARSKIKVMDVQAVIYSTFMEKEKKFWEGILKLFPVSYCHESFAWVLHLKICFWFYKSSVISDIPA